VYYLIDVVLIPAAGISRFVTIPPSPWPSPIDGEGTNRGERTDVGAESHPGLP